MTADRPASAAFTVPRAPIHPPSGKGYSAKLNFRFTEFSEVRLQKAVKASGHTSEVPPMALALELVVIIVVISRRPGNGSPLRSQHITAARWVGRIEHHALQAHLIFLEVREIELTPRQRDAISHMTVRISKMWVPLKDLGHQTPGHEGAISLVLKAHLERQKP